MIGNDEKNLARVIPSQNFLLLGKIKIYKNHTRKFNIYI